MEQKQQHHHWPGQAARREVSRGTCYRQQSKIPAGLKKSFEIAAPIQRLKLIAGQRRAIPENLELSPFAFRMVLLAIKACLFGAYPIPGIHGAFLETNTSKFCFSLSFNSWKKRSRTCQNTLAMVRFSGDKKTNDSILLTR